jgi:Mlc titration factor MtfA (ptsG expression regulator)
VLDHYGATDHAEFFAVATEAFFERPAELQQERPELYDALRRYYRQDPGPPARSEA